MSRDGEERLTRLFRDAEDNLRSALESLFANHAAKGCLQSGATIKASVAALDGTIAEMIADALQGIRAVAENSPRKRRRLLAELAERLDDHHKAAEEIVRSRIDGIGLGSDFRHAEPLIQKATLKHRAMISDFGEGWTAPAGKTWNERHPVLSAVVIGVIVTAVGAVITAWLTL